MPPVQSLDDLERAIKRNTRWVTVMLALFILLIVAGCIYAYVRIQVYLSPEVLARRAVKEVENNYPEIRKTLQTRLVKAAPELARAASKQIVEHAPETRKDVEQFLDQQIDLGLNKAVQMSEAEFRKFLRDNRADIQKALDRLRHAPQEAQKGANELDRLLQQRLGVNVREDARKALKVLRQINDRLETLARNKDLSESDKLELRILRTLRALEVEELPKIKEYVHSVTK